MSRCVRCDSCHSSFDMNPCRRCNFPYADTRTDAQIKQDKIDYDERIKNLYYDDENHSEHEEIVEACMNAGHEEDY